mmetsp:Transcript_32836/g.51326  ORF Transcript_32836/g.51326 Transcript_32836/m.51326 type:complete len:320 (-) Transcript_32836:25-984(-)
MYGVGSDLFIDRKKENQMLKVLGDAKLAQPLLVEFKNGIVYRFTPGIPLDRMKCLDYSKEIALEVAKWHSASTELPLPNDDLTKSNEFLDQMETEVSTEGKGHSAPAPHLKASDTGIKQHAYLSHGGAIWSNLQSWLHLATKVPNHTGLTLDFERVKEEVKDVKARLESAEFTTTMAVCHNDLLPGNIIYDEEKKCVTFIDLEYCAQNPAGFDIANHFCELGNDYEDLKMDQNPEKPYRFTFYKHYYEEIHKLGGKKVDVSNEEILEKIDKEIFLWRTLAHLRWVFWAVIQGHHSNIEFDYGKFAQIRFGEYEKMYKSL